MKKSTLNPSQSKAVHSVDGHILVLAGAGSGKTSVLISRIIHLIEELQVPADAILGLTFTNKAAGEMRSRIAKILGTKKASDVMLSTFHSFCFYVLKKEIHHLGYAKNFTIYDDKDIKRIQDQIEGKEGNEELSDSKLKAELISSLKAYNAVNFDGLLELTCELFTNHSEILERYQNQFRYIMIDEYQDTNPIQFQLASLLSQKHKNLFVVGDDDQAIYSWRGSEVKHILQFPYNTMVKLEENYRSTQPILDTANHVINKNTERHRKTLFSKTTTGDLPHLFYARTDNEEAEGVVERILKLKREKELAWSDFAILYRSNHLTKPFELALMQAHVKEGDKFVRGIPYRVIQGTEFFERAEVRDFFSYLKVAHNPKDTNALLRILNYPRRGISIKTVEILSKECRNRNTSLWEVITDLKDLELTKQAQEGISDLTQILEEAHDRFNKYPISECIDWLIRELNFKNAVEGEVKSDKAKQFKWENVKSCIEMAKRAEEDGDTLADFLGNSMLDQYRPSTRGEKDNRVNLLTFHSAKGLEFTACFLVCIEDGILPHERSLAEGGEEEERRLFYVALTRAKKYLTLSMAEKRAFRGKPKPTTPSRFLFEIPKEQLILESNRYPKSFDH